MLLNLIQYRVTIKKTIVKSTGLSLISCGWRNERTASLGMKKSSWKNSWPQNVRGLAGWQWDAARHTTWWAGTCNPATCRGSPQTYVQPACFYNFKLDAVASTCQMGSGVSPAYVYATAPSKVWFSFICWESKGNGDNLNDYFFLPLRPGSNCESFVGLKRSCHKDF
jgi:hypothetical protein